MLFVFWTSILIMIKSALLSIVVLLLPFSALATAKDSLREELKHLLKERQELFDSYSRSLVRKSGIFNHRTKNDLRESHDRLKEIVESDNRIMSRLNRLLEFRNLEKQTMGYDKRDMEDRIAKLNSGMQILLNKNNALEQKNKELLSKLKKQKRNFYILLGVMISAIILMFFRFRKKT
ncbi:MAG: hypothetical protein DWQ44_13310 [Bacteroidetes bacterium]|nr:MAG: hypothetical protein DWQ33_13700 [Bacteroidota bacterium]REK05756.1 MAG: hypothetical protein DWQ39_04935 [Bacteroidota bacterium]REK31937.1 MAG: hypothetical protein DWQ44_13310 [Bacteroidota bacterium]REK50003.1 MAG: hypothetical protein DWQ48_05535 [Bacteroidota bacterium]